MKFEFNLCSNCLGRYRALRVDSKSKYAIVPKPFNSLVWPDEHPDRVGYFIMCCAPCRESMRLLAYARTHMWRYGGLPEALADLWNKAQSTMPDWPGFQRLSLNETQLKDLATCPEQFDTATATDADRPDRFLQNMQERPRDAPGLVNPGSMSSLGLDTSVAGSVIRCPNCREYVDASSKKCRFCNSELDSAGIETSVAQRAKERAALSEREAGRNKISAGLSLAAIGVYFLVPTVQPAATAVKLGIVLLLICMSLSFRLRH